MKKVICIIAVIILIPLLSSCYRRIYVVPARPEPPSVQAEVVGPVPYVGAVWVGGHWVWVHGGYVWVPGHWRAAY